MNTALKEIVLYNFKNQDFLFNVQFAWVTDSEYMLQNRLPTIVLRLVCKALSVFKCLTGHVNSFIDINEHTAPLVNTVNDVYTDAHMHLKHKTCI